MIAIKIFGIFLVAVVAELGGTYLVWKWLREGASFLLAFAAASALVFYAVLQTSSSLHSYENG